jgi:hypothetical protein
MDGPETKPEFCRWPECDRKYFTKGLCMLHYARQRRTVDMDKPFRTRKRSEERQWRKSSRNYMVMWDGDKIILQHRFVWEQHNGRKLQPFENIHHLNGIRDDNRIENLELWTKPQPIGQRPEDLVAWVIDHYRELVEARLALF